MNGSGRNGNNKDEHNKNDDMRGPMIGCFVYGGNHFTTKFSHRSHMKHFPQQHHIHAVVDHRQVEYQATPIQMTGTLFGYFVSLFIDTGAIECFIDPKMVAKLPIRAGFMAEPWTIEYGKRVEHRIEQC